MQSSLQRKVVTVDRGLFLIRYVSADDALAPPIVRFAALAGSREDLRFLLHPDESEPVLRDPGSSLVLRADMPGRLAMDIAPSRQDGSVAASIRFEPLRQSPEVAPHVTRAAATPTQTPAIQVMGHVASRGDVAADAGAWLAGPAAPARIEGFAIHWPDKPPGVDLRYRAKTNKARVSEEPWVTVGEFVGSRGHATPIVGLEVEIVGIAAAQYRCAADLLFLGASVSHVVGQRIDGSGPTGREPLVGLRLSITGTAGKRRPGSEDIRPAATVEQVKIFRSETSSHPVPA